MGKVQILAVLTMDGCLSSELYDKAHQDLCLDRCGLDEIGKKAEHHQYNKSNNPTEIAKHQRCSKRYEYGKEPAKEQQHTPVKVVMLPFVPYLGYIPHIVDEADPVFAIVLFHTVISIQRNQPI